MTKFRHFALAAFGVVIAGCQTVSPPVSTFADSEVVSGKIVFESVTFKDWRQESIQLLISDPNSAPKAEVFGYLNLPKNISGKVPAMILAHDSSGPSRRDIRYAKELNQIGIATFRIDSYSTRRADDNLSIFSSVADAYFALKLLSTHPQIDKTRIGIIGWSRGGSVAHMTAFEPFRKGFIQNDLKFAVHIPFFRGCTFEMRMPMTNASVRELIGEKDNWTGVAACVADAKRRQDKGYDVEVILYPRAHHSFDRGYPEDYYPNRKIWHDCRYIIEADGSTFDPATQRPWNNAHAKENWDACASYGVTQGRNAEASNKAMIFVKSHLGKVFGL